MRQSNGWWKRKYSMYSYRLGKAPLVSLYWVGDGLSLVRLLWCLKDVHMCSPAYIDWLLCVNSSFQQYSKQLEETMDRFAKGEIKILICTNIVESGLDIQNANTIIIQDVQQFGLAQLYQACYSILLRSLSYPVPCYLGSLQFRHEGSLFLMNVLIPLSLLGVMTPQMPCGYPANLWSDLVTDMWLS